MVEEGRLLTVVLAVGRFIYKRLMIMKRHCSKACWERRERNKTVRKKMSQVDLRIRKSGLKEICLRIISESQG